MTTAKLLSAVVLAAAAALTTPAMARSYVATQHATSAQAERSVDAGSCVRAPRVGAYATSPWAEPPCEVNTGF